MSALLVAKDARIEANGDTLADSLSFTATGEGVGLVGDWSPLFRLFSRTAALTRGSVKLLDGAADTAAVKNQLGIALLHASVPVKWTVIEYLVASAELTGLRGRARARAATKALGILSLGALAKRSMGSLSMTDRRAVGVAHALVGDPPILLLDRPFDGLADPAKARLYDTLERAMAGRRVIVGARAVAPSGVEAALLDRMDHVVVIEGGSVTEAGAPPASVGESRRCLVHTASALAALTRTLVERGLTVERVSAPGDTSDEGRLMVILPEGTTSSAIVDAAVAAEAPLLELRFQETVPS